MVPLCMSHCGVCRRLDDDLEVVGALIRHGVPNSLTANNDKEDTPVDCLIKREGWQQEVEPVVQFLLRSYAESVVAQKGSSSIHYLLEEAYSGWYDDDHWRLPVGTLDTDHLQSLLEDVNALEPGAIHALNRDSMLPLLCASRLNFPDRVIYVLLRLYPDALFML